MILVYGNIGVSHDLFLLNATLQSIRSSTSIDVILSLGIASHELQEGLHEIIQKFFPGLRCVLYSGRVTLYEHFMTIRPMLTCKKHALMIEIGDMMLPYAQNVYNRTSCNIGYSYIVQKEYDFQVELDMTSLQDFISCHKYSLEVILSISGSIINLRVLKAMMNDIESNLKISSYAEGREREESMEGEREKSVKYNSSNTTLAYSREIEYRVFTMLNDLSTTVPYGYVFHRLMMEGSVE